MRALAALIGFCALTGTTFAQPTFSHPDRIKYDGSCFQIDGKDTFIFSGAFHYFRCPKELWRERFKAIKDAGFNAVETYVAWNWHEREKPAGLEDNSKIDLKDLDDWLTMAEKEFGLYTIVRPGPYICAEWATGGYPNWLLAFRPEKTKRSLWLRSDDPTFLAWCRHWFLAVAQVVKPHQIFNQPKGNPGVILWQLENEYSFAGVPDEARRGQVKALYEASKEGGIEVPNFTCWTDCVRAANGDPILSQVFDTPNQYVRWDIEGVASALRDQHQAHPWAPKMITELQGGWFGQVGGLASEEQDGISASQIGSLTLFGIQNGLTALNYYMLFGGTNFGDWAGQGITTSYDYFSPIREWGGVGNKYRTVQAVGKFLAKYGSDLARSEETAAPVVMGDVKVAARRGKSGATFAFIRNPNRAKAVAAKLGDQTLTIPAFGTYVLRYTSDLKRGEWVCKTPVEQVETRHVAPAPVDLTEATVERLDAQDWKPTPKSATNVDLGVYDSRWIAYRAPASQSSLLLQVSAGELIELGGAVPERRPGHDIYGPSSRGRTWLMLNPGWSNGGPDMERPRGVLSAREVDRLPSGAVVSQWKYKMIPLGDVSQIPSVQGSETWADVVTNTGTQSIFKSNTAAILTTTFDLKEVPTGLKLDINSIDDDSWIYLNDKFVAETHEWSTPWSFEVADKARVGTNRLTIVVKNSGGEGGINGPINITGPMPAGRSVQPQWTDRFAPISKETVALVKADLPRLVHPKIEGTRTLGPSPLVRSTVRFKRYAHPGFATEILLDAAGDGFLTLNGRPLGRFWESGPQRAFYLPETWLKDDNVLELTVVPGRLGDRIKSARLRALPMVE